MRGKRLSIGMRTTLAMFAVTLFVTGAAASQETVLHSFSENGTDGGYPYSGLIFDSSGNLYGTTSGGGAYGFGTVFELTPAAGGGWTETVLHTFNANAGDGSSPTAGLVFDSSGNLYGTTYWGGAFGEGTVFELTPTSGGSWTETLLYSFNGADGANPYASLIFDSSGNIYGTTYLGGSNDWGTVFELAPTVGGSWTETVLHNFNNDGKDGYYLYAGVILDGSGNLYGTTFSGGNNNAGLVFELTPETGGSWTETVLHQFAATGKDGYEPQASLVFDALGNLYGTTYGSVHGAGAVFELTPTASGGWSEILLHNFSSPDKEGAVPEASLILDTAGNLYGTTSHGGVYGYGVVFELRPAAGRGRRERVLRNFNPGADGFRPEAGLIFDTSGNLYGTTLQGGGSNVGVVFEITP